MICSACGKAIPDNSKVCDACGVAISPSIVPAAAPFGDGLPAEVQAFAGKKIAAGVCGILLGSLGVHKFILGLTTPGIIMLLVTLLTCGIGAIVMSPIGIIEGIVYLTKTDEEFYRQYAVDKRGWF